MIVNDQPIVIVSQSGIKHWASLWPNLYQIIQNVLGMKYELTGGKHDICWWRRGHSISVIIQAFIHSLASLLMLAGLSYLAIDILESADTCTTFGQVKEMKYVFILPVHTDSLQGHLFHEKN